MAYKTYLTKGVKKAPRLLFIQRHPVEALLSHTRYMHETDDFLDKLEKNAEWLMENLRFYEAFKRSKLLLVYEDLVHGEYEGSVRALGAFLKAPQDRIEAAVRDYALLKEDCKRAPRRKSVSTGSSQFHAGRLTEDQKARMEAILRPLLRHPLLEKLYGIPL